ncbi:MAG: PAS domain-containing sensor histidine kinase [bacterium]
MLTDISSIRFLKWILAGITTILLVFWAYMLHFPEYDGFLIFFDEEWRLLAGLVLLPLIGFYLGFLPIEGILRRESHLNLYLQRVQYIVNDLEQLENHDELGDQASDILCKKFPYQSAHLISRNDDGSLYEMGRGQIPEALQKSNALENMLENDETTYLQDPHLLSSLTSGDAVTTTFRGLTNTPYLLVLSPEDFQDNQMLHRILSRMLAETLGEALRQIELMDREQAIQEELNEKIEERTQEIRQQQQFLESVLRSLKEGLIVIEETGSILDINEMARSMLSIDQSQSPDSLTDLQSHLPDEILDQEETQRPQQVEHHDNVLEYEWRSIEDGDRYLLIIRDRTEIQKLQEKANINETLSTLGEMAGAVVHELRNPLGAMEIYLGMLKRKSDDPELEKPVQKLEEGFHAIQNTTETLLNYTRTSHPEFETISPNQLIQSALKQCRDIVDRRDVTIENKLDELPSIQGDFGQLLNVFVNLIRNGIEAHDSDQTPRIEIYGRHRENFVEITVEDRGGGMTEDEVDNVFDRFFSTKEEGTGLGLAICKRMVEVHSGDISVDSSPGKGSKFTVQLPLNAELIQHDQ